MPMVEWEKSDGTLRDYIVSNNHYAVLVNGYYSIGKLVHPSARSLEAFRKISNSDQQCVQSSHNAHRCEW